MKFSLVVLTPGKQEGKALEIKLAQFLVGRDPQCQLRPASPMISKRHCALIQRDGKVFVRDFGSTNGTHVNDEPVQGERELSHDDQLKIGPLLFGVQIEVGAPAAPSPTPAPPTKPATKPVNQTAEKPAASPVGGKGAAKQPAPSTPTPPPAIAKAPAKAAAKAPAAGDSDEEDFGAMLLSLQDDGPTTLSGTHEPLPHVPEGSTVHDLVVPPDVLARALGGSPPAAVKGGTEQAKDKAKSASGNTSNAAKSILEKMMRRPRPQ